MGNKSFEQKIKIIRGIDTIGDLLADCAIKSPKRVNVNIKKQNKLYSLLKTAYILLAKEECPRKTCENGKIWLNSHEFKDCSRCKLIDDTKEFLNIKKNREVYND